MQYIDWQQPTLEIAYLAGQKILEIYNTDIKVEFKDDKSPLTAADLTAHLCIVEGLAALTPDIPVLSEESSNISWQERRGWDLYWLVDPLDGTKEFVKRNGEFTVNIALIHDHRPVLGVVYVPVTDTVYCGGLNADVFVIEQGSKKSIAVRQADDVPTIVGSRSHRGEKLDAYLQNLGPHSYTAMGSSIKFCLIAEGKADCYPRLSATAEWDTAAAQAVVEAAGGQVLDLKGRPMTYNMKESLLNPDFIVTGDRSIDWHRHLDRIASN